MEPLLASNTYTLWSLCKSAHAIKDPSADMATALTPRAPLASLNLYFFSPVQASQVKIAGDLPTWPETAVDRSELKAMLMMSSV